MPDHDFEKLYMEMERCHVKALWLAPKDILPLQPQPKAVPWLWKWSQLSNLARRSGELVTLDRGGDRRAMGLSNPGLPGAPYVTNTLWAAVQWLNGREVAPAHRHTAQAIRFMICGRGAYSTVQGDRIFLEPGDFAINPPWHWHDHGNESDEPAVWLDVLDIPLNNYLEASFFEPASRDVQDVTTVRDASLLKYGLGQFRPAWESPVSSHSPISVYKWALTERALNSLARVAASPFDDVALEFTNPHSGRPVLETMTAWIQMIRPGIHTRAHRQVNSAVYYVHEGQGATIVGGVRFDWEQGDIFAIPSWIYHEHINESKSERAILFSMHDTPVLVALGKYREEALTENNGFQTVKETFDGEKTLTYAQGDLMP